MTQQEDSVWVDCGCEGQAVRVKRPGPVPTASWDPEEPDDMTPCLKPACVKAVVEWYYRDAPFANLEGLSEHQKAQLKQDRRAPREGEENTGARSSALAKNNY